MIKRNGFTLVELLAVIVILAIILAVAIPGISGIINGVKVNAYKSQMQLIEDAAKKYMMDDFKYEDMKAGEVQVITLQQLYDSHLLDEVRDPNTNLAMDSNSVVYVSKTNNFKVTYTYENESDCRYNDKICLKDSVISDLVGKSQSYQGGTYYKGTNATILNNYVWYSGQEYRIMGINSDGSIKMVTSLPVVAIAWGPSGTIDYTNSYARKWLNILPTGHSLKDDYEGVFYKSLNRPDLIEDYQFCIGKQDPTSSTDTTCSTKLTDKVGLLTWWEYKIAGPNINGVGSYLNINNLLTFLTGDARTATNLLVTYFGGNLYSDEGASTFASYSMGSYSTSTGIRPVINLKSTASILNGNGTSANPYSLIGDEQGEKDETLNSRHAGEYLNLSGRRYRIVSKDVNGNTKIVTDNAVTSTATTGGANFTYYDRGLDGSNLCENVSPYTNCTNHFDITDGSGDYDGSVGDNIGYFLNSNASNSFCTSLGSYQSYLENATYYFGKWGYSTDYKTSYTDIVTNGYGTQDLKVGMLVYGEMLAGNNANSQYWLLNPYISSIQASLISGNGDASSAAPIDPNRTVHPTLSLKSSIKIVSGNGTKASPYEITN